MGLIASMFLIRWIFGLIKGLLILIGLATVLWWGSKYYSGASPIRAKIDKFTKSGMVEESFKDVQILAGEVLKEVKLSDTAPASDITHDEKKQIDDILAKEINGNKNTVQKKK